ncbi:hypothetical protein MNBD_GAMMA09-106 [hydrothermal vent metagenome]|uniref:Anti sigma-E protein RseA N-terminal domain-containing protein n=1 Tax=hydrothermal vent metagenome TaxID=652676 RepID=A0A3B0XRF3_9ZZZZ
MKQIQKEQQREEQLSALLDNALDEQQLETYMEDLKRDPITDAETAQRYRLMGDVMREELDPVSFMDISAAIHRKLEQEPEHHTPVVAASVKSKNSFNLSSLFSGWLKPVSGIAVAASVATVTLLTFNSLQVNTGSGQNEAAQFVQSQPVELQRVNPEIARNVRVASTLDVAKKSPEQIQQLNRYMLQHSGYASQTAIQEMIPHVRVVEFKSLEKE